MLCVRTCLKTALPAIGLTAAFHPLAQWYFRRLADGGDEPLGLAVLLLTLVLIWKNQTPLRSRPLTTTILLACYATATTLAPGLPPMLRAVPALAVIALYYGWQTRPGWLALLALSLPVVASMQFYLGYPMRLVSAEISRWLLTPWTDGLAREGTTLVAHGKIVGVDPPCSGIRMLWAGLVLANTLAALTHMGWRRTATTNLIAATLLILCNSLRTTLLYAPESGVIDIPPWLHEGIGILCYATCAATLAKLSTRHTPPPPPPPQPHTPKKPIPLPYSAAICALGLTLSLTTATHPTPATPQHTRPAVTWPTAFDGIPLEPLDPTPLERQFQRHFPGHIATFRCGDRQLILRHITTASRKLHPSANCLRASGHHIGPVHLHTDTQGRHWAGCTATKSGHTYLILERITSPHGNTWTDTSSWYWHALFHPTDGPWLAQTIIQNKTPN